MEVVAVAPGGAGVIDLLVVLAGLIGLMAGSGWAVRGAEALARRLGMSPMVIGLTVLAVGTSLPELATNLAAGWELSRGGSASGIAIGNIVGSCLSQATLLLGIAAFVATIRCERRSLLRDGTMVLVAMAAMWIVCLDGTARQWEGGLLVAAYVAYVAWVSWRGRGYVAPAIAPDAPPEPLPGVAWSLVLVLIGLALVTVCAERMVHHGSQFARELGIGEDLIGLWVGVGTGLPELTVAIRGLRVAGGAMSLGNLLGSNITDPMLSFGAGVMVHDMTVADVVLRFDFPCWFLATGLALMLLHHRLELDRRRGVVLIAAFAAYMGARAVLVGG